eukprot:s28_g24.t1
MYRRDGLKVLACLFSVLSRCLQCLSILILTFLIGFAFGILVGWSPDPVCLEAVLQQRSLSRQLLDRMAGLWNHAQTQSTHWLQLGRSIFFFLNTGSTYIAMPIVLRYRIPAGASLCDLQCAYG